MKYLYFRDVRSPDPKDTIAFPWGGVQPQIKRCAVFSQRGGRQPEEPVVQCAVRGAEENAPPPKQPVWPFHYVGTWLPVFLSSATALLKWKIRRARC